MKRILYSLLFIAILLPATAQESGIRFFRGNWDEAIAMAQKEKKKIFIDFYTIWCNPCLYMTQKIFPLPEVGNFYNKRFVCLKIDAEKGEGPMLAKKYDVQAYPTFVFINPENQTVLHRSAGAREAADFIADADGALNTKLGSVYLDEKYQSGNYDAAFLKDYIRSNKASGNRYRVRKAFEELLMMGGKLTDPDVWQLYYECIHPQLVSPTIEQSGYKIPYIKEISDNYQQFTELFGKQAVDTKLADGTQYTSVSLIKQLCDFEGKDYNLKISRMIEIFREKGFDEAWDAVDQLIADTTLNQLKFVKIISSYAYINPKYTDYELSFEQLVRKIHYTRYVAYNMYDREDVWPHFTYAAALEHLLRRSSEEKKQIPADLLQTPRYGKKEYNLESPLLAPKPKIKSIKSDK